MEIPEKKETTKKESNQEILQVPSAVLTGITFGVLRESDVEKLSILSIEGPNDVTDPRLGLPNPSSSECPTCGAAATKECEGHFGHIKLHHRVLHPFFVSEAVNILNKICPGCKSIRNGPKRKTGVNLLDMLKACKYCYDRRYPPMRFRISSSELFRKMEISVEVPERLWKSFDHSLPEDYWNFLPKDMSEESCSARTNRRSLTHNQIYGLLKNVNLKQFKTSVSSISTLFLRNFIVTPNFHRVTEFRHAMSNGERVIYDDRTRAAKKLVGFKGAPSEQVNRYVDYLKLSKLHLGKQPNVFTLQTNQDAAFNTTCSKWMKEVILTKRSDHIFRTVITGDPNLKLDEVGIPRHIAERMQISDHLNFWNWEKLAEVCTTLLFEKGKIWIRRKGDVIPISELEQLQVGDVIKRPLVNGDTVLINRPPSIHQHSLIAMKAKIVQADDPKQQISTKSDVSVDYVVSINPLICSPLRGDFDGDCLHGFIPQSVESRVELQELVALDKQLYDGQSGKNLLSLTHDSLTAANLLLEDGTFLDNFQMQQLQMLCPKRADSDSAAIVKAPSKKSTLWTGKQAFSMALPADFDFSSHSNSVHISKGEILSSPSGSSWLRGESNENFFEALIRHCNGKFLDHLYAAQQVLCAWLSHRGLSVSLLDLYLSSDISSRMNMIDEVRCGLEEAERTCQIKQLMVEPLQDYLTLTAYEDQTIDEKTLIEAEKMCFEKQKSAALCRVSVGAFKQVFRDVQNLMYQYAAKDNSLLAIVKSGSRSSPMKLVQQAMSLGLQHSMVPLSFKLPHKLSCESWNRLKAQESKAPDISKSFIPYAVIESSFLVGLNPLECFVHSVTSRDSSFRENADVPGTLNRRLTFFMRDLQEAYDGTVRSAYGSQLYQFSYEETASDHNAGGHPVGSLAASAISEAAYSALDQPVSVLEPSPLFTLKRVLESGLKRSNLKKTASLFLSEKLRRLRHGFEYAALEIKNHLEGLLFSDIVSTVLIEYSDYPPPNLSHWVCHFHVRKDIVKRRRLKVHSIIDALHRKCTYVPLPKLQIEIQNCSMDDMAEKRKTTFCITAAVIEGPKGASMKLDMVRDVLIPNLLQSVVKGRMEFKKIDILWNDDHVSDKKASRTSPVPGELYLKVHLSTPARTTRLWNLLMDTCLPIMELIDWNRSHPDDMHDMFTQYGIDTSWRFFLGNLKSAVNDVGKTVLPQHLVLVADCLSVTGEFVGLGSKGMSKQKAQMSVSSPFLQACFSSPGVSLIKAAKAGAVDHLQGSLDSLAWGKVPPIGTGAKFDVVYSSKAHEIEKPANIYNLLRENSSYHMRKTKIKVPDGFELVKEKCGAMRLKELPSREVVRNLGLSKALSEARMNLNDIVKLSQKFKTMLNKYSIDEDIEDLDQKQLKMILHFHPRSKEKIGPGVVNIKVGRHPEVDARCFLLERKDGTFEDFSYRKCVIRALEIFAPNNGKRYKSKRFDSFEDVGAPQEV